MKRQESELHDLSSSDDDSLPDMGSLRERLARKRRLDCVPSASHPDDLDGNVRSTSSKRIHTTSQITAKKDTSTMPNLSSEISTFPSSSSNVSRDKDLKTKTTIPDFSDTSSSEDEQQTLSQVISIGNSINRQKLVSIPTHREHMIVSKHTNGNQKKTKEELENMKLAKEAEKQMKKLEKESKEAEKQMRKVERESKKQFSVGSCLQFITVLIDTHIVNTCGFGAVLFKECQDLGVECQTRDLPMPFTIMWRRRVIGCNMSADRKVETQHSEIEEADVLAIVPVLDFVLMINTFKQRQRGLMETGVTLSEYVKKLKVKLPDSTVTIIVPGLEQYFRDVKTQATRQHREAVKSTNPSHVSKPIKSKLGEFLTVVSRVDVEEGVTDTQLHMNCCTMMLETQDDIADYVRRATKAVAERPAKKDRFDPIFSFHEEGSAGVKVDKNGVGLLKAWKQQLLQFKNVSPDVAQALIVEYPSPQLLVQAYKKCSSEKEAIKLLENIVVRRGAGVLETSRRVGKELARRVYIFFTSTDPDLVIK